MSGRGLGHTGGTVDKLESIPGFATDLPRTRFFELLSLHGIVVAGQSGNLAPADKKMYALRDATATVDSIPLIAASIMSKKLAAGAKNIVLDVKSGSGALMKDRAQAYDLAHQMVDIAHRAGRNCMAYITDMSRPLGANVGNALEVVEAIRILQGEELDGDLATLCISLSAGMIHLAKKIPMEEALATAYDLLESGKAFDSFRKWISVQGGDLRYVDDPALLPLGKHKIELFAEEEGFLGAMNTEKIGMAARALGAGRIVPGAKLDHGAGIVFDKHAGDPVLEGERVCTLYADDEALLQLGADKMESLLYFEERQPEPSDLIQDRITAEDLYNWD
jgi:pyrimidine-nucleoside phosphorylase